MASKKKSDGSLRPRRVGSKKSVDGESWNPSEQHWEWYRMYTCEHKSYRTIASLHGVNHTAVVQAVKKVSDHIKRETFNSIMEFRARQTTMLSQIVEETMESWKRSKGEVTVRTIKKLRGEPTKKKSAKESETAFEVIEEVTERIEISHGNTAYTEQACRAMADIRKIWGIDKPTKIELGTDDDGEGLERVAGMNRAEAIRKEAERLLQAAKEMEESEQ